MIGGPPGAGKSTLGRALARELGFDALSIDDLLVAGRVLTSERTHPSLHETRRVGHLRYFTDGPPEKLVADAVALEETMWPVVEAVIASRLQSKSPVVIDWWLLPPKWVAQLDDGRITSIWLHLEPVALEERERSNTEWMEGSSDRGRMLSHFLSRSLWRNELVAAEAAAAGLTVLHLDGSESTEEMLQKALGFVRDADP